MWKGVDKLRFGCLSEFALRHFKEAAARERPSKNEVFLRFKLFAEIMVICFTEDLNGNGSCFRSFEHLEKKDKIAIGADIGITIRIMEVEEMPTDEMKHLIYNLWSKCCNYVNSNKVMIGKDPIKVMIDTGKIPKNKKFPTHLQIGTLMDSTSTPIYIFIWFNKSLFIQKNHSLFTIPSHHIEQVKNKIVKISLEERGIGKWVCLYGNGFNNTAKKESCFPYHRTTHLLDTLKTKNGKNYVQFTT